MHSQGTKTDDIKSNYYLIVDNEMHVNTNKYYFHGIRKGIENAVVDYDINGSYTLITRGNSGLITLNSDDKIMMTSNNMTEINCNDLNATCHNSYKLETHSTNDDAYKIITHSGGGMHIQIGGMAMVNYDNIYTFFYQRHDYISIQRAKYLDIKY